MSGGKRGAKYYIARFENAGIPASLLGVSLFVAFRRVSCIVGGGTVAGFFSSARRGAGTRFVDATLTCTITVGRVNCLVPLCICSICSWSLRWVSLSLYRISLLYPILQARRGEVKARCNRNSLTSLGFVAFFFTVNVFPRRWVPACLRSFCARGGSIGRNKVTLVVPAAALTVGERERALRPRRFLTGMNGWNTQKFIYFFLLGMK